MVVRFRTAVQPFPHPDRRVRGIAYRPVPSTVEEQSVHLDLDYPDARSDLNRWLPLVKWLLVIPHIVVLAFLGIGAVVVIVIAWFAILFTDRYPPFRLS
jgi:hypothetical protein